VSSSFTLFRQAVLLKCILEADHVFWVSVEAVNLDGLLGFYLLWSQAFLGRWDVTSGLNAKHRLSFQ